jgi:hypothetical protein
MIQIEVTPKNKLRLKSRTMQHLLFKRTLHFDFLVVTNIEGT